jgi:hypothetical protein
MQHPVTIYTNQTNEQKLCCSDFREMKFLKLSASEKQSFEIDSDSPVFMFKDGRSKFVAVELPVLAEPAAITLETHVISLRIEPVAFDPFIMFLDRNLTSLGEVVPQMKIKSGFLTGRSWETKVPVPPAAGYAIVYTKPVLYQTFMYYNPETSLTFVPGKIPFFIPTRSVPIMAAPHGKVSLEISARKVGADTATENK